MKEYSNNKPWIRRVITGRNSLILAITAIAFIILNIYRNNDPIPVGTKIEDFQLKALDNITFNLSQIYMPKIIIFYKPKGIFSNQMYNNYYLKALPEFKILQDKDIARVIVLTYNTNQSSSLKELTENNKYKLLKEIGFLTNIEEVSNMFGIRSYPHIFVLDSRNNIIFESKFAGADYIKKILWRD